MARETLRTFHCTWPGCTAQHVHALYLLVHSKMRWRYLFDCPEDISAYIMGRFVGQLQVFVGETPVSLYVSPGNAGTNVQMLQRLHETAEGVLSYKTTMH